MLFNSYIFILFFLPIAIIGYYGLNYLKKETCAKVFLVIMSLWFYAYFNYAYIFIILGSIIGNFIIAKQIHRNQNKQKLRKCILGIGVFLNIGIIFYYKYYNFFADNINVLFDADFTIRNIVMPLGISFFTFQQISYLVDSYRGETKNYSFLDYSLFVTFFPQLIAGPIVFHDEMIPQFSDPKRKRPNQKRLSKGVWIFAIGLFKKVMIADVVGKGVVFGFNNIATLSTLDSWLVALCYTLQIYFDFSGYCDMAIGIANMFNIDLPINFNSPYKATSVTDFWKRWHITLTRFLTKYLYIPLGGNRKSYIRTLCNILIVYLISGLWHGAAWTFILWGILHGIARVYEKVLWKVLDPIPKIIKIIFTFIFVNITWVLFRARTVKDAMDMYYNMFIFNARTPNAELYEKFDILELTYIEKHIAPLQQFTENNIWINMAVIICIAVFVVFGTRNCYEKKFKVNVFSALTTILLLVWSIISLSGLSEFLYFNF